VTQPEAIRSLLNAVAQGHVSPDLALDKLKYLTYEPVDDFANIDHHRAIRTGFPEVIWGPGKTPDQIAQIMNAMRDRAASFPDSGTHVVMATRIEPEVYIQLKGKVPDLRYYALARICALHTPPPDFAQPIAPRPGIIGLLSAGTADLPVAEEAAVTAELCGFQVNRLWDMGVAGIHRLLNNRQAIAAADVLIVVAGMEGALPSVVAGLSDCPVIAVPTSIGYGASFNGLAALLSMLNSCATGVGVVNIDNGFGAAMLAGQMLRMAQRMGDRALRS
jgi:pyridinium-3,5-biscarboxylic acid mononucleotide synthase